MILQNKFYKLLGLLLACAGLMVFPGRTGAATVTDWYIKNFDSQIVVNKDSTLNITENILADCGNAPNKHGIFRILPLTAQITSNEIMKTPVYLQSITNFQGKAYQYVETINGSDKTITWKIGDPNVTVHGENGYKISYIVKNSIRTENAQFDEFYWNLNGNFWELETDKFTARIVFPAEVIEKNTQVNLYSGSTGQKDAGLATSHWENNTLVVESTDILAPYQGITVSVTTPKNIFTPYTLTAQDNAMYKTGSSLDQISAQVKKVLDTIGLIWPIIVLVGSFLLWRKYGQDPKINRAVAPEFEIPNNLTPIEMGMVDSDGKLQNHFISATIINLAVNGYIAIEIIGKHGIFTHEDYKLKKTDKDTASMSLAEQFVFNRLFPVETEVFISKLKNVFYVNLPIISTEISTSLKNQGLIKPTGTAIKTVMLGLMPVSFVGGIFAFNLSHDLSAGLLVGGIILLIFAFLMPARTEKGAELELRIKGFKMYMETAEKYRQQFNEKENIFEQLLPYAIMFQLTGKWIKAMKNIYGEEYFNAYQPIWLHGMMMTNGQFNLDNFATTLDGMTSNMASTMASNPSSSGSGGGGFSGGGGGGGGGGGW